MRNKTTAVILAVLFGYWAWIYTYKLDAWKFWMCLLICLCIYWSYIIPFGFWIWAIIDAARKQQEVYLKYK